MIRPIVAVTITNPVSGKSERIYALIDSGADRDYLSTDLGERLGLITSERYKGGMDRDNLLDIRLDGWAVRSKD